MSKSPPLPRPEPKQARSRRTERALLDAASGLFRARGVDGVTVGDIAKAARVAPGTIYRRFGDKERLEKEAFRRHVEASIAAFDFSHLADTDSGFVERAADVTALVLKHAEANRRLMQSAYAKALVDDEYGALLVELRTRTFAILKAFFLERADEIGHPDPDLALDFALRQAIAMLSARHEATRVDVASGSMSDAVFVRELMRSILGYLEVDTTEPSIDRALSARGL